LSEDEMMRLAALWVRVAGPGPGPG
jgi:hypothetical protein